MILSVCPNGKCRCWCSFLAEGPIYEFTSDQTPVSPRLRDLVASNDVPLDFDKQLCQSMLHDVQEDINTLDGYINDLERILSALKDRRNRKANQAHSYRSVLSPVRRLPVEILSKFFCETCPALEIKPHSMQIYHSLNRSLPLWTLTEVSAHWRQVAISTPKIWSTISILMDKWADTPHLQRLRLQLHRSNPSPLTIALSWNTRSSQSLSLAAELSPSSLRWETVCIDLQVAGFDNTFASIRGRLPALHTLRYVDGVFSSASNFALAPKLRTVYTNIGYPGCLPRLPVSQITTISATLEPWGIAHLSLIADPSVLERCFLDIRTRRSGSNNTSMNLPNLRILELRLPAGCHIDLHTVLDKLTLPALEVLKIQGGVLNASIPVLVRRSRCIMIDLHLQDMYLGLDDVSAAFEELTSLERLTLDTEWQSQLVAELASHKGLLPSLGFLHVVKSQDDLRQIKDSRPRLELITR